VAYSRAMQAALSIAEAVVAYLRAHPDELVRAVKNAVALRVGVPMAALRWAIDRKRGSPKAPKDVEISAVPPGVRVAGSFEVMGTPLRGSAEIYAEDVRITGDELMLVVRLKNLSLKVTAEHVESPLAALLRSGALDLSKPGNLLAFMPKRPALLVDARDDRITLDLFRHPKLGSDRRLRKLVSLIVPFVTVGRVESENDHLDVALRPFPDGVLGAVDSVRRAL
jgi:hypothetical protein